MGVNRSTPLSFQGHLQNVYYSKETVDETTLSGLLTQYETISDPRFLTPPLLYLIDYTKSAYMVMTESAKLITGYDARDFLDGGIEHLVDVFQSDDFKVYNTKVFPANLSFLQQHPPPLHERFIFSYNFRVKEKDGSYVSLLQRGRYITSPSNGLPLYSLGYVVEITAFKRDTMIYHTIDEVDTNCSIYNQRRLIENFFYPNEEDMLLSKREKCILCYMAEGMSSKQIAWKLRIAENTIANHRKNMLRKTNTKNVAQLISFACQNKLV